MERPTPEEKANQAGLTSIHRSIHCPATQEPDEELDRIEIENFLDTLTEIATAIAKRKAEKQE
jgi:hypothetical protein